MACGAPHVHISGARLLGQISVQGGRLTITECSFEVDTMPRSGNQRSRVLSSDVESGSRALSVTGGHVVLVRTEMCGLTGAIYVDFASLALVESTIRENRPTSGGVIHVRGNTSEVHMERSLIIDNSPAASSAALQVDSGRVYLRNETRFERNGGGGSIVLSAVATVQYTLPAPPGRWLFIRQGTTFQVEPGTAVDSEFPFDCPAGVVGGTSVRDQSGPGCSRQCDAGTMCPPGTMHALPCPQGHYCPQGTVTAVACDSGTFSTSTSLTSAAGCEPCPLGRACPPGTSVPELCAAGRFGETTGQTSRECSGPCAKGYFCAAGSTSDTSAPCQPGSYNRDIGGSSSAACRPSPVGSYVAAPGAQDATRCSPGYYQHTEGSTQCEACHAGEYQPEPGAASCIPCKTGQHAVNGSARCTICASDYYRPLSDSSATECTSCDAIPGVRCDSNTTIATLTVASSYWRHSMATIETHLCKSDGGWSPCRGGADAGHEGDGYCAPGYLGPRCELCDGPAYSKFFDKLDARCHGCGDMATRTIIIICAMLLLILLAMISGSAATIGRLKGVDACSTPPPLVRYTQTIWQDAGMRYKVKALVGFYQCIAAVPSVYNVQPPLGLEHLTRWIHLLELPSEFERIFFVPTACLGNYSTRIWVSSIWPLVVILAFVVCFVGAELVQRFSQKDNRSLAASVRTALADGLQRVLPVMLGLTFLVLPSTSTRIFRAFLCETFQYDDDTSRRYLYADLTLSCDSDEYESTKATAFAALVLWPVGMPLLYAVLLWASRDALRTGIATPLSRATAFLWGDYACNYWAPLGWWEPLEMCRKLTLTGWVLLIRGDAEQTRVIVALFVSITFFGLNLRFRPQRRCASDRNRPHAGIAVIL